LGHKATDLPDARELDVLAATGEQCTAALTAIAIGAVGGKARSFLGHQIRILTDSGFGGARIVKVERGRLEGSLARGEIPVVAGFQGVDRHGHITTLSRGGSDTTAVALAAALGAHACEIYTDVDGVYTADPNVCPGARRLPSISYDQMITFATLGAKVLHPCSVALARKHRVPIHVRSSFHDEAGTVVSENVPGTRLTGLACIEEEAVAKISVVGHGLRSQAAVVAGLLDSNKIPIRAIQARDHFITYTIAKTESKEALKILHQGLLSSIHAP
jgi:aspartate kinase